MPTLTDLASRAGIRGADLDLLHALVSDWQLLADLSFADLVLWAPLSDRMASAGGAPEGGGGQGGDEPAGGGQGGGGPAGGRQDGGGPAGGRQDGGATRPGGEATRPGARAARPGDEATRPGARAARPGDEAKRPRGEAATAPGTATAAWVAAGHLAIDGGGADQTYDEVIWPEGARWIALAQMRPTTAPTALPDDIVGSVRPGSDQPFLAAAYLDRRVCREGDPEWTRGVPVRHETIPVLFRDRVIAVIERSTNLSSARTPSRLDLAYLKAADDLTQMVAAGMFPSPGDEPVLVRSPRVGDGMLRLSRSGKVTYASPNGLSAYRRLGLTADLVGRQLGPLTARLCAGREPRDDSLMVAASGRAPAETEVDANGSVVQLRTIPLVVNGNRAGALILLRDVTELRHRERELLTKDATIREIHHRVKNNLQTVAALLRLQARRLAAPEARAALEEAVRRVGSIAMVHETLSHVPDEIVDFDEIAERVAMMAGEVSAPEARAKAQLLGEFGLLPALIATPLALVLTELLQNAFQHGLSRPGQGGVPGCLEISAVRGPGKLTVVVSDNGVGLPDDFDLDSTSSLGLQIVRTLVLTELNGQLEISPRPGGGTRVLVEVPLELKLAEPATE